MRLWTVGIRQNRLAQMLEVDETVVSKVINGFREPNQELRQRIAQVLEADERWLFEPLTQLQDTGSNHQA
jgi:transcriptional regulator with XRE-family HTH domain